MPQAWPSVLLDSVTSLPAQEKLLTRQVAGGCAAAGATHLWLADDSRPPTFPTSRTSREQRLVKKYDLAWTTSDGAHPEHLCQVKLARPTGQEDQEVLLFLGDVLYAGLDARVHGTHSWVLAGLPRRASVGHWGRLLALAGVPSAPAPVRFLLHPQSASAGLARGASWIDAAAGVIAPTMRSQYNKIFGAGTTAKYVGLWVRPGRLALDVQLSSRAVGSGHVLLAQVTSLTTEGIDDLQQWWP